MPIRSGLAPSAVVLLLVVAAACGGSRPQGQNPESPPPSGGGEGTVNGSERLGWDQELRVGDVRSYTYVAFVDEARVLLTNASCAPTPGKPSYAGCSSPLPPMGPGRHVVHLASRFQVGGTVVESDKSAPFVLTMTGAGTLGAMAASDVAAESGTPPLELAASEGTGVTVTVASRQVRDVSDLAVSADGDVFVAERAGVIRIFREGAFWREPALMLSEIVPDFGGPGLLSVALPADFAADRRVYFAYTAETRDGLVYRIASGREVGGRIGEVATIMSTGPASDDGVALIRIAPDGKVYAALSDEPARDNSNITPVSRIYRLNPDGSTPHDSPGFSRAVMALAGVRGLAWGSNVDGLYAIASGGGTRVLRRVQTSAGSDQEIVFTWPAAERPAPLAWYGASAIAAFAGRMLVGTSADLQIIDISARDQAPLSLSFGPAVGAASAVAVAPDGSVYVAAANRRRIQRSIGGADTHEGDFLLRIAHRKQKGGA